MMARLALRGSGTTFSLVRTCHVEGGGADCVRQMVGLGSCVSGPHQTPHSAGLRRQSLQGKSFQLASWQRSLAAASLLGTGTVQGLGFLGCTVTHACVSVCTHKHRCGPGHGIFLWRDRILCRKQILLCEHHFPLNKAVRSPLQQSTCTSITSGGWLKMPATPRTSRITLAVDWEFLTGSSSNV